MTGSTPGSDRHDNVAATSRRIDPQVALDLLARHMWIADGIEATGDGLDAAASWDNDFLLTDTYEEYERMAREAVYAEMQRRSEPDAD